MASPKTLPLEERIESIRAELDALIDRKVAEVKKQCPGVPEASIRYEITRGTACQCAAVLDILRHDEKAKETAA